MKVEEKKRLLAELESFLPDLRSFEEATVDVTFEEPLQETVLFFKKALDLFNSLDAAEKKKCPPELLWLLENMERFGIKVERVDRSLSSYKTLAPSWTLILNVQNRHIGVFTLGKAMVGELKKSII